MNSSNVPPKRFQKHWLRFGIPSLDRLFSPGAPDKWAAGIDLRPDNIQEDLRVSMCIIGPSGTGKSLMGLHLASRYWADTAAWEVAHQESSKRKRKRDSFFPSVIYVSTDLALKRAQATWKKFGLNFPNRRKIPFNENLPFEKLSDGSRDWKVDLCSFSTNNQEMDEVSRYLIETESDVGPGNVGKVAFVDLAESTAGDDWGYIARLLALLPTPEGDQPCHLVIIDAVEGLEMLVGDTDAYGQLRSRRSRVAQILRAAASKSHVVLILEEDIAHQHPPEEYVTDVVMRLRVSPVDDYLRRSLEVVKARGQTLIRGEHDYLIRGAANDRKGTKVINELPDDPACDISYIQLVRSLHSLSRAAMWKLDSVRHSSTKPGDESNRSLALFYTPRFGAILRNVKSISGLPRGRTTCLIGDEATYKSRLGRAFLAGAQRERALLEIFGKEREAGVLITTFNVRRQSVLNLLHLHMTRPVVDPEFDRLFFFRQIEIHHLNSSVLFHIIRRCVEKALVALEEADLAARGIEPEQIASLAEEPHRPWFQFSPRAGRVRVVIDDWTLIRSTFPEIAADPRFLPFLMRYFESVGLTVLIIATQPGRPEEILSGTSEQPLRALSNYHLYTWHVPFYGSDRVAIAAIPPVEGGLPVVSELRLPFAKDLIGKNKDEVRQERLWIDPHFELYKGVEQKDPQPVALEVHLFSATAGFERHAAEMDGLLNRLFAAKTAGRVIVPQNRENYAFLRDFCKLHGETRCDHTLVIQVDEYWKEPEVSDPLSIPYLLQRTFDVAENLPAATHDPYEVYQPPAHLNSKGEKKKCALKHQFFNPIGLSKSIGEDKSGKWCEDMTEVPYLWDFGFLLLRERAWEGYIKSVTKEDKTEGKKLLGQYHRLIDFSPKNGEPVSWRDFFDLCRKVTHWNNRPHRNHLAPFDVDLNSPQSFACLVLEVWLSELRLMGIGEDTAFPRHRNGPNKSDHTLAFMLDGHARSADFRFSLFKVWLLLVEVLNPKSLIDEDLCLMTRCSDHQAAAVRYWYSTGSLVWKELGSDDPVIPARLPGHATTRGDWFLTVGRESRSRRLGERAIDLICRRRSNLDRLRAGVGLPVRKLIREDWDAKGNVKKYDQVLTAMAHYSKDGRRRMVRYSELLQLGSRGDNKPFQWLWRSRLAEYHQHDRVWERWLGRLVSESVKHLQNLKEHCFVQPFQIYDALPGPISGNSEAYDRLISERTCDPNRIASSEPPATPKWQGAEFQGEIWRRTLTAWVAFNQRCDHLVSELTQLGGARRDSED